MQRTFFSRKEVSSSQSIVYYVLNVSKRQIMTWFTKMTCFDERLANEVVHFFQTMSLRERLRTHKVFTKGQCFYLNYHKFSIKSYVMDVY